MATVKYKRDFKELEQPRRKRMRMLARGLAQAELARQLGVSRQTVSNWGCARQEDVQVLRRKPLGKPGGMSDQELARLAKLIVSGAIACGFLTELWTLARVATLIEREFGRSYGTVRVWRLLKQLGFPASLRKAGPSSATRSPSWNGRPGVGL